MTDEERSRLAAELGLGKFAERFPDAFDRAFDYAQSMLAQVPRPKAISDEPAHVYRADREAET